MKSKITSAKIKELNKTNETAENTNIELDSSITNNNEVPESTSNITAPQIIEVTEDNEICYR